MCIRDSIGTAQSFLFKQITEKLFTHVQTEKLSEKYSSNIVIAPNLINIEISKPKETGLINYECRLEYFVLIKTQKLTINRKILAYSRSPESNKPENRIISELMSQCLRTIASKLEITLLELTNEI